MARYNQDYLFTIVDINGDQANVRIRTNQSDAETLATMAADEAALATLLAALTNGKIIRQGISVLFNEAQYLVGTAPPNAAEYSSVTDGAKLSFADGAGERTSVTIPAPLTAVFGANSNVVDPTVAVVANFIAGMATYAASPNNVTYNLYKGGVKTGRHSRRRATHLIV